MVQAVAAAALLVEMSGCGDSPAGPQPQPTVSEEDAYIFTVTCGNCPGLTNVEIDRSVAPHHALLGVGLQTSLRAVAPDGCKGSQPTLQVTRWVASDPTVIQLTPSSSESAIVTALKPGTAEVTANRQLADGTVIPIGLRDAFAPDAAPGCAPLPALVFAIVP
jgi:hypothetical protein